MRPFVLAVLLLCGGGWGLQQYQKALYESLPACVHAERPLFFDSLGRDDGLWRVHPATSNDGSYQFANGAYRLTDGWDEALLARTYASFALQVTARIYPSSYRSETMGQLGEVGIVLRDTGQDAGLMTFTIGPLGDWALMRYRDWGADAGQWQVLAAGLHSHAVHWGLGVPNQLLVLARGPQYACFVNGLLVAAVSDDALLAGRVGLWVDDNTIAGAFNDFAVYPAV